MAVPQSARYGRGGEVEGMHWVVVVVVGGSGGDWLWRLLVVVVVEVVFPMQVDPAAASLAAVLW